MAVSMAWDVNIVSSFLGGIRMIPLRLSYPSQDWRGVESRDSQLRGDATRRVI